MGGDGGMGVVSPMSMNVNLWGYYVDGKIKQIIVSQRELWLSPRVKIFSLLKADKITVFIKKKLEYT